MSAQSENVLREALALSVKERADIAAELLASLDDEASEDPAAVEAAWAEEIQRRVAALDAGTEKLESWENVKHRIAKDILRR